MRVIFMGTPDFAQGTLEALIKSKHEVVLAVTQPDRPKGRGKELAFPPVKTTALQANIPVFQPEKIKTPEAVEYLRQFQPDVIVVVAFGQILSKDILEMPTYGCINVHASLLPKYRGASPIQWAVINGERETGVTTMRMDEGLDTGDMILVKKYKLEAKETGGSLFDHLMDIGASACLETLEHIEAGTAVYTPQDHSQATKTGLISKELGHLNFSRPARELERLIRGLNPWPSAFTYLNGKMLKIWDTDVLEQGSYNVGKNGEIIHVDKEHMYIQTGEGILVLNEVQPEGKKRMTCSEYLRGYAQSVGTVLGI